MLDSVDIALFVLWKWSKNTFLQKMWETNRNSSFLKNVGSSWKFVRFDLTLCLVIDAHQRLQQARIQYLMETACSRFFGEVMRQHWSRREDRRRNDFLLFFVDRSSLTMMYFHSLQTVQPFYTLPIVRLIMKRRDGGWIRVCQA